MGLTVKLPVKNNRDVFSLYVKGKIKELYKDEKLGTLIKCEGCGIAFYSASNSRRAIVFSEINEKPLFPCYEGNIPYFKEKVRVIYKGTGRKIELLKFMCYNLEKKYGMQIYELGSIYWLTLSSYIDSMEKPKNKLKKYSNKRFIYTYTDRFIKRRNAKNESL